MEHVLNYRAKSFQENAGDIIWYYSKHGQMDYFPLPTAARNIISKATFKTHLGRSNAVWLCARVPFTVGNHISYALGKTFSIITWKFTTEKTIFYPQY